MQLHTYLPLIRKAAGVPALNEQLATAPITRFSVLEAAKPAVLAALQNELAHPTMLIVSRMARGRQLAEELTSWIGSSERVILFPELDSLPYERLAPGAEHLYDRLRAMLLLTTAPDQTAPAPIVIVTARGVLDRVMRPEECRKSTWQLSVGDRIRPDRLVAEWVAAGYEPVSVVEAPGEFARRGGILDIFPTGQPVASSRVAAGMKSDELSEPADAESAPAAYRIELWGDDVDSIRLFEPATQRSTSTIPQIIFGPAHEVRASLNERGREVLAQLDLRRIQPNVRDQIEDESRMLLDGQPFARLDWWRAILADASILDYLPPGGLLILDEPGALAATARELHRQAEELYTDLIHRGEVPANAPRPYWTWEELTPRLARTEGVRLDFVLDPDALSGDFVPAPSYSGHLPALAERVSSHPMDEGNAPETLLIVSQQAGRLAELLDLPPTGPNDLHNVRLLHGSLSEGWSAPHAGITLLTDRELFGWAKMRRSTRHAGTAARDRFLSDLEPGELVVHIDHGIGRYRGLVRIADRLSGIEREYLDIEYADTGRLRVPAEFADRVNRYVGSGEAVPALTKLGSGEWQRAKSRIRVAVQRIARELVELYATRELAEAPSLGSDSPWQMELEASFPYIETPDQLTAIQEVKQDLERPRPMDRLLVGDVGYGKTEVALRAAFKAVMAGKQVGVLVPTTVLAQQHLKVFRERLAPFPVRVEMLSRFLTDKQARAVVEAVREGTVDIVIGTHRLLQKDVQFKELGLVIIDEEQRFGVGHKERFKQLRTEVHVLTLSATPIPRTLHLSLVGVRDLSMIQTPPEERLPIRTYVTEFDDGLVREAILRELDRGGQVYYVSNRVYSIGAVAGRLQSLVPEARIAVGHGQMGDEQLEDTMIRFAGGEADVLVCTTIIEAGLDLPNVNTIIVTNAHQFGLSQLYQLRGRVGRGANRAYAYFLYGHDTQLSEIAEKRLRAIFEATAFGSGYRIALKDLEIRGAGNLLGVEQHGHISAVGFDLYCRLLGEAVDQLKALRTKVLSEEGLANRVISGALIEIPTISLNLPVTASLPTEYVADESARLNLYQRLAAAKDGESLGALIGEIEDRFGPIPESAMNLFYLLSLRQTAIAAGIEEISIDGSEIVLRFKHAPTVGAVLLERVVGVPIRARANQLRMSLGKGARWMTALRDIVDNLAASTSSPAAGSAFGLVANDSQLPAALPGNLVGARPLRLSLAKKE